MTGDGTEVKELQLINAVELKFALASSDRTLEQLLKLYLCPLLLKLASKYENNKRKVLSVCSTLNLRIDGESSCRLPLEELVLQYANVQTPSVVKTFLLTYVSKAMQQTTADLDRFLPLMINDYSKGPDHQQSTLFQIICFILRSRTSRAEADKQLYESLLATTADDEAAMCARFMDIMLLNLGMAFKATLSVPSLTPSGMAGVRPSQNHPSSTVRQITPTVEYASNAPGLMASQLSFLLPQGSRSFTVSSLNDTKLAILRFLSLSGFKDSHRFLIALLGSFDLKYEMQSIAGDIMKRQCAVDPNDPLYVDTIYKTLLERRNLPIKLQSRLYQLLSCSSYAASLSESALRVINKGFADESVPIRISTIGFIHWFAQSGSCTAGMTKELLMKLTDHLSESDDQSFPGNRGFAYTSIGILLQKHKTYLYDHIDVLDYLFSAVAREERSVHASIIGALTGLANSFQGASQATLALLQDSLFRVVCGENLETIEVAIKICISSYPFSNTGARWLCMLATRQGNPAEAIVTARQGLEVQKFNTINAFSDASIRSEIAFPSFMEIVQWQEHNRTRLYSVNSVNSRQKLDTQILHTYFGFGRQALYSEALLAAYNHKDLTALGLWQNNLDKTIKYDSVARSTVQRFMQSRSMDPVFLEYLENFTKNLFEVFLKTDDQNIAQFLYELLAIFGIRNHAFADMIPELRSKIKSATTNMRTITIQIHAVILCHCVKSEESIINELAYVGGLGHEYSSWFCELCRHVSLCGLLPLLPKLTISDLNTKTRTKIEGARGNEAAIGEGLRDLQRLASAQLIDITQDYQSIIRPLIKKGLAELGAHTIGFLTLCFPEDSVKCQSLLEILMPDDVGDSTDLQIARGEALSCCIAGWGSKFVQNSLFLSDDIVQKHSLFRPNLTQKLVDTILSKFLNCSVTINRKAACIWFLCILEAIPNKDIIDDNNLVKIHNGLLAHLLDRDTFVADAAKKGITLCYDRSNKATRSIMLRALLSTFSVQQLARSSNSRGAIEETVDGETSSVRINHPNLETFTDLCNLAQETGNNEMIYQFMSLASSQKVWTTKLGTTLSFESLLTQVQSMTTISNPQTMRRLVAKLFRYRHDPVEEVRKIMQAIFQQLFPDVKSTLSTYFEEILTGLVSSLSNRTWRIRQAAVESLTEILGMSTASEMEPRLGGLWPLAFRVLDDVHEGVRQAASKLCKALSRSLVNAIMQLNTKALPPDQSISTAIEIMQSNLKSPSLEISAFALSTLLLVIKTSNKTSIRQLLPDLVSEFLLMTSSMEPEMLNYLSFHTSTTQLTTADLDDVRMASIRSNPLISALEDCVDLVDEVSVAHVVAKVSTIIRQNQGFPTRAATSRFLISMVSRQANVIRPHVDTLLQALSGTLNEPNETVLLSNISAIGYLSRLATTGKLLKLNSFLVKKFFGEPSRAVRVFGMTMQAISQYSTDRFLSLSAVYLPVIFIGRHTKSEPIRELFESVWTKNTGSVSSIRLYQKETLLIIEEHLSSSVWEVRQMCAAALAELVVASSFEHELEHIVSMELSMMSGRVWPGKEELVHALVATAEKGKSFIQGSLMHAISYAILEEVPKSDLKYRRRMLQLMTTHLDVIKPEMFTEVQQSISAIIKMDPGDADEVEARSLAPLKLVVLEKSMACLAAAYQPEQDTNRAANLDFLVDFLSVLVVENPWNIKLTACVALDQIFVKVAETSVHFLTRAIVGACRKTLLALGADHSYQSLREAAAKTMASFLSACRIQEVSCDSAIEDILQLEKAEPSTIVSAALQKIRREAR